MRFQHKHPEVTEQAGEQFRRALRIRFWTIRNRHALEIHSMLLGEFRLRASDVLESLRRVGRNNLDIVHVASRAKQVVADRNDEAAETMKLHLSRQQTVHV